MLNVLVADDDFTNLDALSTALAAAGHRVLRAGDGADALRILSSQPCDVVVCNEDMHGLDGPQLVTAIHANTRLAATPVIVMVDAYRTHREPLHGAAVIAKPVRLPVLLALVDRVGRGG